MPLRNAPDHDLSISRGVRQRKSSANQSPEGQGRLHGAASQQGAREVGDGTHRRRERRKRPGLVEIGFATAPEMPTSDN